MNIEKAIKSNTNLLQDKTSNLIERELDAVRLGIEALKQTLQDREGNPLLDGELLPGETEE